jgi:digeranylgeranylglycerophospholipid reductase
VRDEVKHELEYDVVVVGAGPAGSTTARYAAMNDANVLMIEKRQEIGSPVRCGEGIGKALLEKIDLEPNKRWIANEVLGARVISPNGSVLTLTERMAGDETGYVIYRDVFDKELAKIAAKEGVDIMLKTSAISILKENGKVIGVKAKHMGRMFDIKAKVVVGADGFESQIGRWAGINTNLKPSDVETGFQYHMVGIDCDKDFSHFYLGSYAPGGYVWIFPKAQGEANVGIGLQLSKIKDKAAPKRYLDDFIKKHKELAKGKAIMQVAGAVSTCAPIERTIDDGIMLVGDAARQIDALTGGGIINACEAGKIAGETAAQAIKEEDVSKTFLNKYEKGWRDEMEDRLYRNWIAKEKLAELSDDTLNKLIDAISTCKVETITTLEILRAVQSKYPELVKEFEEML